MEEFKFNLDIDQISLIREALEKHFVYLSKQAKNEGRIFTYTYKEVKNITDILRMFDSMKN